MNLNELGNRSRDGLADDVCRKIADEIVLDNFAPNTMRSTAHQHHPELP